MKLAREVDCLIASGTAVPTGPQFLASSTVLALAKAIAARGRKAAILVVDPALDPALVRREESDGVAIFHTAQPVSSLPALAAALGQPRILLLPNQLARYRLLQTPGLDAVLWLGEDDLVPLGQQALTLPAQLWADSDYVTAAAQTLTQKPVASVAPPSGPPPARTIIPQAGSLAVVGARPRDGIALTLALANLCRDRRFIVIEWPYLDDTERQHFFARAAGCGNIDWRRPDGPAALLAAALEAAIILAPVQQPIGHRDWIRQCRQAGRLFLASHLGALPQLIGGQGRILPATAPAMHWLEAFEALCRQPSQPRPGSDGDAGASDPFARILAHLWDQPAT